jgi:hypothetical protein
MLLYVFAAPGLMSCPFLSPRSRPSSC